jgi:hypothetical protein
VSVLSLFLQRPQQLLQATSERLRLVQSQLMLQAQPLSQAFLERRQSGLSQLTLPQMFLLLDWKERLRLAPYRYLATTTSALRGLKEHQQLELSLRLQRLMLFLQVCLLLAWLAAHWCGEKLFQAKTQTGKMLMTVKHQAGQMLMIVKHRIGKR